MLGTLPKTNIATGKSNNFDGIYQEYGDFFVATFVCRIVNICKRWLVRDHVGGQNVGDWGGPNFFATQILDWSSEEG